MSSGDSCFLQLLDYRCTATRTGSSRRGQDGCLDTCFAQFFRHFLTEFGSVCNGGRITCRGKKERIEFAYDAFLLQLLEYLVRSYSVAGLICIHRVISCMY